MHGPPGYGAAENVSNKKGRDLERRSIQRKAGTALQRARRRDELVEIVVDEGGDIVANKLAFHSAIRQVAGKVLDVSVIEFSKHPPVAMQWILDDLSQQFTFSRPLKPNFVQNYLQNALAVARYTWRKWWIEHKTRHPSCPPDRYPALAEYWSTPAAEAESERMKKARKQRRRSHSAGSTQSDGQVDPSPQTPSAIEVSHERNRS